MKKAKRILFPTDFSEASNQAFQYALLLADQIEAAVTVLHISYPVNDTLTYPHYRFSPSHNVYATLDKRIKRFIEDGLAKVDEKLFHHPEVTTKVDWGMAVGSIVRVAEEEEIDLIVIGSRGETKSVIDKMLGSVAAGVVEKATCPVIVVPTGVVFHRIKTIAYATALQDGDPTELIKTINLLTLITPNIEVVHIQLPEEKEENIDDVIAKVKDFFKGDCSKLKIKFHTIPGEDLHKELNLFAEVYHPDLLVMYQTKHSFWNRLLFKSNTKEQAKYTRLPLLVQK